MSLLVWVSSGIILVKFWYCFIVLIFVVDRFIFGLEGILDGILVVLFVFDIMYKIILIVGCELLVRRDYKLDLFMDLYRSGVIWFLMYCNVICVDFKCKLVYDLFWGFESFERYWF